MTWLTWKLLPRTPRTRSSLGAIAVLVTLLISAAALARNGADPDLWGHVQYGRDACRDGLPTASTYNYTAVGYRWINHENLAELGLAIGMDWFGPHLMLLGKCLLGVAIAGLVLWNGRRQGGTLVATCAVTLLTAVNLSLFWTFRPQVLTCVWFALLLTLLDFCFRGWAGRCHPGWLDRCEPATGNDRRCTLSLTRLRGLWLAPGLFVLWTNSHGGFVAGLCIFAAYLAGRSAEVLAEAWMSRESSSETWRRAVRIVAGLSAVFVASIAATFVNPYGSELHAWLLRSLGAPRPEIVEWRPPDLTSAAMAPFVLMSVITLAVLLLTRRSRDLTHVTLLLLTLWQSFEHVRHIAFFAIAFGFWIVPHVDSVLARFRVIENFTTLWQRAARWRVGQWRPARWALGLALAALICGASARLVERLSGLYVDRHQFPVAAIEFLGEMNPRGRLVVTYNWAQYAIAAFGSNGESDGLRVSFDGRFRTCYPQEVVDMNFDFVLGTTEARYRGPTTPPFDDTRVLEYGRPDLVLIDRGQPHSVAVMERQTQRWVLLYQDEIAQVWGRRSSYDNPDDPRYVPPRDRLISNRAQTGSANWPALPTSRPEDARVAGRASGESGSPG